MTHDRGMPHARKTVPHHVGWKGSSVCSEPQRAYGTQTRSLDWLQQPRIYMHTNSSHCRMRLFPYEKLAPFWMQKFPFSFQPLPQGGRAAPAQAPWPPERLGGNGPCHAQYPPRAVCPSPSFYSPDSPGTKVFLLENPHMALGDIFVCVPVDEIPEVLHLGTCLWRLLRDRIYIQDSLKSILMIVFPQEKQSIQCTEIPRGNTWIVTKSGVTPWLPHHSSMGWAIWDNN